MSEYQLYCGDALGVLRTLPAESIQCCITSPPYFRKRDYGTAIWEGGEPSCSHRPDDTPQKRGIASTTLSGGKKHTGHQHEGFAGFCPRCGAVRIDRQIGQEETPEGFIGHLVEVFAEVKRVLRDDGTCWVVIGDSYANDGKWGGRTGGKHVSTLHGLCGPGRSRVTTSLKPKDLIGIPWALAFALRDRVGFYLRAENIWNKLNGLPESVTDRTTRSHEHVFHLAKSARYYYNADAIREPNKEESLARAKRNRFGGKYIDSDRAQHGALKAGNGYGPHADNDKVCHPLGRNKRSVWSIHTEQTTDEHYAQMPAALVDPCVLAGSREGEVILDPFCGLATVGKVALLRTRNFIGIDLNPAYIEMARRLLYGASSPLLGDQEMRVGA